MVYGRINGGDFARRFAPSPPSLSHSLTGLVLACVIGSCDAPTARFDPGDAARRLARAPEKVRDQDASCAALNDDRWALYERGRRLLEAGRAASAVLYFEAAGLESECWAPWNDLSVALHARWRNDQRPIDLVRALDAISSAGRVAGLEPEVLLNSALIASDLALVKTAGRTWKRFLEATVRRDSWRPEREIARLELVELESKSSEERWRQLLGGLRSSPDLPPRSLAAVVEVPHQARLFLERDFFGLWAEARAEGEAGAEVLRLGLAVSSALAEARGEAGLSLAVRSLARCVEEEPSEPDCVDGFEDYGRGVRIFYGGDRRGSEAHFARAVSSLGRIRSPLVGWARYFLIYSTFDRDLSASELALRELLESTDAGDFPTLASRLHWRLGVALATRGESAQACRHFEAGTELARKVSGDEGAVFGHVLLAEEYEDVGDSSRAWFHRLQAARGVVRSGVFRSISAMLGEQVDALLRAGFAAAASAVAGELIHHAAAQSPSDYTVGAWIHMGRARLAGGDATGARLAFQRAAEDLEAGSASDYRTVLEARLATARAQMPGQNDHRVLELLDASAELFAARGLDYELMPALALRAAAKARLGLPARAVEDLEVGLAWLDRQEARVEDESRLYSLRNAQQLVDRAVPLLVVLGEVEKAVETAERFRLRWLRGRLGQRQEAPARLLTRLAEALGRRETLVYFFVLPSSSYAVVAEPSGLRTIELDAGEDALRAAVRRLEATLRAADPEAALEPSARLHDLLFAPLGIDPSRRDRIVFIPDRSLFRLPFAALFDPASGRFLIEDTAVAVSPTLALFLEDGPSAGRDAVAVVANPELEPEAGLPELPGAEAEAIQIAKVYARAEIIAGREATRQRFLEALGRYRVLHYAGHAVADTDIPGRSRLLLAAAGSEPGDLVVDDALGEMTTVLPELIVLSACQTADGLRVDREGPLSFAAGLFAAGARAVVASLGDVDDRRTPSLSAALHRHYAAGLSPSRAYRDAVREQIRSEGLESLPSWSQFTVLERASRTSSDSRQDEEHG